MNGLRLWWRRSEWRVIAAATAVAVFLAVASTTPWGARYPALRLVAAWAGGACGLVAALALWLAERRRVADAHRDNERHGLKPRLGEGVGGIAPAAVRERARERERQLEHRLHGLLVATRRALNAHAAVLYVRGGDDLLHLRACDAAGGEPEFRAVLDPRDSLLGWVLKHDEPFRAMEYQKPVSGLTHYRGDPAVKSFLAVPVRHHHGVVGVLAVDSLEVQAFAAEEHQPLLDQTAVQAADWLVVAAEQAEVGEELVQWRAFFDVALALQANLDGRQAAAYLLDLMDTVAVPDAIALIDMPTHDTCEIVAARGDCAGVQAGASFPADAGWVGWAVQQPDVRAVDDLRQRRSDRPLFFPGDGVPREGAAVCVPFGQGDDGARGGLVMWSRRRTRFETAETTVYKLLSAPFRLAYDRARAVAALETLATTDALTGLRNRRVAMEHLEQELRRADRSGAGVAVVLGDVDRFKSINDRFGHGAGDDVLRAVASRLRQVVRDVDMASRYGGEEFLLVLSDAAAAGAAQLAERARKAIRGQAVLLGDGRSLKITMSFGVAAYVPGSREALDALLNRADQALYAAKEAGRDAVRVAEADGDAETADV